MENAAYPVGTCAERVAFGKAVVSFLYGFTLLMLQTKLCNCYCVLCSEKVYEDGLDGMIHIEISRSASRFCS